MDAWKTHSFRLVTLIVFGAVIGACSGGGDGDGSSNDGSSTVTTLDDAISEPLGSEVSCQGLQFSARQGVPGDRVTFQGLPGSMDTVSIRVLADTGDGEKVAPLFVNSGTPQGTDAFTVPLHPSANAEGGQVELEIGDGEEHCPVVTFDIQPLPSAPPDYLEQVQPMIEQWTEDSIRSLGYNPPNLLSADPSNLSPTQKGLRVAWLFASSNRDGALPALASEVADDGDDTLERLVKASGLEGTLRTANRELNSVPGGRVQPASSLARGPNERGVFTDGFRRRLAERESSTGTTKDSEVVAQATSISEKDCSSPITGRSLKQDPDKLAIANAAELAARMRAADKGTVFTGTTSSRLLGALALGNGLVTDRTGATLNSPILEGAGWLGAAKSVLSSVERAKLALQPQTIESFDLLVVEDKWVEDRPATDTAFWDKAQVFAEGKSFNLSKRILESAVTALGLVPGPIGEGVTVVTTAGPDAVSGVVDDLTKGSCIRVKAPRYGPINVDDPRWTKSKIEGSTFVQDSHTTYHGVDIGMSTLKVELQSQKFAENDFFVEERPLQSEELAISLFPAVATVTQPGQTISIEATARNAYSDPAKFSVSIPSNNGSIKNVSTSGDRVFVDVVTPQDRNSFPVDVRFQALQPTLPRGTSDRVATATIELGGKVDITPDKACLKPNQSLNVSASVDGFRSGNESVSWSATSGRFTGVGSQSATFVAPNGTGEVDVTATADADGSVTDTVRYTLSNNCIKKEWNNTAIKAVDGDGVYSEATVPGELCPPEDNDPTQEVKEISAARGGLSIPADSALWLDRVETLDAPLGHQSRRFIKDDQGTSDPSDDQCSEIKLNASNNSTIRYVGKGDGTLGLKVDIDLDSECGQHTDGTVDCALSGLIANAGGGRYYLPVDSAEAYRLTGKLECSNLSGGVQILPFTVGASRFKKPGDPKSVGLPGVTNPDGSPIPTGELVNARCTQPDQTVSIDVPFNLAAPQSGEDLVVLVISGAVKASAIPTQAKPGHTQPTSPSDRLPNVSAGQFATDGVVDFSVQLRPR